jgi:hypothetical protein
MTPAAHDNSGLARRAGHPSESHTFAERNGPTVLLVAGAGLILASIVGVFTDHHVIATGLAVTGLVAIVAATVLSRMEGHFTIYGLSGNLRPCARQREAPAEHEELPPHLR